MVVGNARCSVVSLVMSIIERTRRTSSTCRWVYVFAKIVLMWDRIAPSDRPRAIAILGAFLQFSISLTTSTSADVGLKVSLSTAAKQLVQVMAEQTATTSASPPEPFVRRRCSTRNAVRQRPDPENRMWRHTIRQHCLKLPFKGVDILVFER